MRHARDQDLDRIEPLLAQIRAAAPQGLKEKKRGVFYFRSQAFLHFHEDAKGMFADVGLGKGFERLQVDDDAGAVALLARVAAVGALTLSAPGDWPDLAVHIQGAVAEVRLNRPQARNAFSLALMRQLTEAAIWFRASTDVQAVILAGAETYFSAGADLADPARAQRAPATRLERRQAARLGPDMCAAWESLEQVTIAAIEGYCIGGAAALAVSLDFRIAGEGAYLRLPEIALGMNMSWGALPRIAALVGPARAKRFAIFCEPSPADQALAWGMVDEVTPAGGALAAARAWAAKVAALPPLPVRMTKEAITAASTTLHRAAASMDRDQWMLTSETNDFAEGGRAFREKRKPRFRGD